MLSSEVWYSVGGGFVIRDGDEGRASEAVPVPFPYHTADELLAVADAAGLSIADLTLANESAGRATADVLAEIDRVAAAMFACIDRGLSQEGELAGGLKVKRRAKKLIERIEEKTLSNNRPRTW